MQKEHTEFKTGNVVAISATHLLHDTFSSFFAPLLPLLSEKLGFAYTMAGMLSVMQRIPSLLNPVIGIIADRMVIRSGIIITPIATITVMSLLGVMPSVVMLAVMLFVCGLSSTVLHVTAPILMRRVSGDKVGRGMSFFMFGGELARTLGPLLIVGAVSWWGLEGTWRLIPFGLAASLLIFFNLRTIDKNEIRIFAVPEKQPLKESVRRVVPFFSQLFPVIFFRGFPKTALTLFLPSYMVDNGHSLKTAAAALAVLELAGAAGALFSGTLSDKIGRKQVLLIIMLASPVLMYLFTLSTGVVLWVLLIFMGLIFFSSTPVFMAMIHDLESDRPSLANAIYMTISFLSGSIIALFVGMFADKFDMMTTYKIAALISLPAIPFTFFMKKANAK